MDDLTRKNLAAVLDAVHKPIVALGNYAQTTDDLAVIELCHDTTQQLLSVGVAARQALQALNEQAFQQASATLKAGTDRLNAEQAPLEAILKDASVVLQVVGAITQIANLVAIL